MRGYERFDKIVLVINDDGYVEGLNFVFGVAKIGGALAWYSRRDYAGSNHFTT
ncbi:hypothetical protein [Vulcanisaeta sp. JCM 16159]|uniref:hypothetical protein n=1 Tax=Vulcanisaeta sp. JCM 16159 TaxID=1295371 RepID=UPI000A7A33F3|nr:hypothetical protein [Vulcanisaeta sp. JCM 16159]